MAKPDSKNPTLDWPELVDRVRACFGPDDEVWLVGGGVRDRLLGHSSRDYDFMVERDARKAARRVADQVGGEYYDLDPVRDTGRVLVGPRDGNRLTLDFNRMNGGSLEADLRLRDFTVDALAVELRTPQVIVDPTGGQADLESRILRACGPEAIASDPVRAWRCVRLSHEFGLTTDAATLDQLRSIRGEMRRVSAERVRDEMYRILGLPAATAALRQLLELELLLEHLPELTPLATCAQAPPHEFNVLEHSFRVVSHLSAWLSGGGDAPELWSGLEPYSAAVRAHLVSEVGQERTRGQSLLLAGLLHDIGKPATRTVNEQGKLQFLGHEAVGAELAARRAAALKLSGHETAVIRRVIAHHMHPGHLAHESRITGRAVYRYFQAAGIEGLEIGMLSLADLRGQTDGPADPHRWQVRLATVRRLFEAYFDQGGQEVSPAILIRGDELMRELDLEPGPQVGRLLDGLRQAQADGLVSTRSEALAFVKQQLAVGNEGGNGDPDPQG